MTWLWTSRSRPGIAASMQLCAALLLMLLLLPLVPAPAAAAAASPALAPAGQYDDDEGEGDIDEWPEADLVEGPVTVAGWARLPAGVIRIEILIDGVPRADLAHDLAPGRGGGKRFRYRLDPHALGLGPGPHEVTVRAVGRRGKVKVIGQRPIQVPVVPRRAAVVVESAPTYAVNWQDVAFPGDLVAGTRYTAHVVLRNTGGATWPASSPTPVRLSYHWLTPDGAATVVGEGLRTPLPSDVHPGETIEADVVVQTPDQPGSYLLVLDLVHEGVTWFGQAGASTVSLSREVQPAWPFVVEWLRQDLPGTLSAGQTVVADVVLRNASNTTWPAGGPTPVRVSYHWLDSTGSERLVWDGLRTPLPYDLPPGESVQLGVQVQAPDFDGNYVLVLDLVQEGVTWFSEQGANTAWIPIWVSTPWPFAVEWLEYDLPSRLHADETVKAHVRLRNASNATWPAGGPTPVRVSYHWYDADDGDLVVWDGRRTRIPHDVAPNQTIDLEVTVRVPDRTGEHRIVFDLVQEDVSWFSRAGAATAELTRRIRDD